jgi:hypothetical protein
MVPFLPTTEKQEAPDLGLPQIRMPPFFVEQNKAQKKK